MICYRELKFPQRAVVFLPLEIDAACSNLLPTLQEKLQCCLKHDVTKPDVIGNRICEGTDCLKAALSSGMTSLQVLVGCGSNEALTLLYLVA